MPDLLLSVEFAKVLIYKRNVLVFKTLFWALWSRLEEKTYNVFSTVSDILLLLVRSLNVQHDYIHTSVTTPNPLRARSISTKFLELNGQRLP